MFHIADVNLNILIVTTTLSFLSVHTSLLRKIALKWLNRETRQERGFLKQKFLLKSEQRELSMVDNFARYSRLQREINAIEEQISEIRSCKPANNLFLRLGITYGFSVIFGFILLVLSLVYRHTPVFSVGKHINLTPMNTFISFPNEANYVSVHFWILCCTTVARAIPI